MDGPRGEGYRYVRVPSTPAPGETLSVGTNQTSLVPGASVKPHRHPEIVVGVVLTGQVWFKTENEPAILLSPGESFFEPANALHERFENPSATETAVVLITRIGEARK
jgi:quercetin dioxygenase-like cupin family protein